ncbi:cytochrome b/b6 domain-containing protein [Vibrio natriegens]|uniref:cytochrome b/b6 domain-containing protein n=1 Tax=Vibrio TaxID=662 RepID=UPI002EBACA59|nr:cytochrome b/b6 domain-containing protein [Vibrio sp. YYF0003]
MTKKTQWDRVVKLTHWLVASLFLINYFITEDGSTLHQWVGYIAVGAVVLRLLWGCIAKPPARLTSFLPSVPKAIGHLKGVYQTRVDDHHGHNPAGAIMIWCMWIGLIAIGISGYLMETDRFWGEDWVKEIHEAAVNLTFACVCVHVGAVVLMTRITGHPYLQNMLPGEREK